MRTDDAPVSTIVWTDADRAPVVDQVLQQMGVSIHVASLGGPRVAPVDALARRLGCSQVDDLRKLVVERSASYLLLGSMTDVSRSDLQVALEHGTTIVTLEPIAVGFDDLAQLGLLSELPGIKPFISRRLPKGPLGGPANGRSDDGEPVAGGASTVLGHQQALGPRVVSVPAFDQSPGWSGAADPMQAVGAARLLSFTGFGSVAHGSLYAQLFEGWRLVIGLGGLPETIDASYVGPLSQVPDQPRGLTGYITAHARMRDGCAAVLQCSDRTGRYERTLHILGEHGELRVGDRHYHLSDTTGRSLDRLDRPPDAGGTMVYPTLIAQHWQRLMRAASLPLSDAPHGQYAYALACCLACQLSARTGQPERPEKLMDMTMPRRPSRRSPRSRIEIAASPSGPSQPKPPA